MGEAPPGKRCTKPQSNQPRHKWHKSKKATKGTKAAFDGKDGSQRERNGRDRNPAAYYNHMQEAGPGRGDRQATITNEWGQLLFGKMKKCLGWEVLVVQQPKGTQCHGSMY